MNAGIISRLFRINILVSVIVLFFSFKGQGYVKCGDYYKPMDCTCFLIKEISNNQLFQANWNKLRNYIFYLSPGISGGQYPIYVSKAVYYNAEGNVLNLAYAKRGFFMSSKTVISTNPVEPVKEYSTSNKIALLQKNKNNHT